MTEVDKSAAAEPFSILGLPRDADDEAVRAAYLKAVKAHPPDSDPDGFERIRKAYDALSDPSRRARHMLLDAGPDVPLESLLDNVEAPRCFTGPDTWLNILR